VWNFNPRITKWKNNIMKIFNTLYIVVAIFLVTGCASNLKTVKTDQPVTVTQKEAAPSSGSIWPGERANNMLFSDRKARYPGDIITIVIDEDSTGENSADTKTSRDTSTTAGIAGVTQATPDVRFLSKYELGGSSTNSLKGKGNTSRDGKLKAKITARVIRLLENGNLLVEGKRQMTVNAEDQYIVISGIVRPEDISSDNVISSQYVADAKIIYTGEGVVNDKMRPGWLTRVVDWVWPF